MALSYSLSQISLALSYPLYTLILLSLAYFFLRCLYRISPLHPLSHIPGPLFPRLTSLWLAYHAWNGDECTVVHTLHNRYGPMVRTGPDSVDITDGAALHDIYSSKNGGFRKATFYSNFDVDGHKSLFSDLNTESRAIRFKAISAMFATKNLRDGKDVFYSAADSFVEILKRESKRRGKLGVNLLPLARAAALDGLTKYLFGRAYGGLEENKNETSDESQEKMQNDECSLSLGHMVDAFVAANRFWYLPSWAFQLAEYLDGMFGYGSLPDVSKSIALVDEYVAGLVSDASKLVSQSESEKADDAHGDDGASTNGVAAHHYPSRLLTNGISLSETHAQCKDLIFAGTDSTGMNLATIFFYLAANPSVYAALHRELEEKQPDFDDLQSLPCLHGVIKEGLRLSMANPSRLTRVVPLHGWTFESSNSTSTYFPAGTEVSCTPFELHFNPSVFQSPRSFDPTRWLSENATEDMKRDAIPFGLGPRQCIARNLATVELYVIVARVVQADCLRGARTVVDADKGIEILEWFNSKVKSGRIDLVWE